MNTVDIERKEGVTLYGYFNHASKITAFGVKSQIAGDSKEIYPTYTDAEVEFKRQIGVQTAKLETDAQTPKRRPK